MTSVTGLVARLTHDVKEYVTVLVETRRVILRLYTGRTLLRRIKIIRQVPRVIPETVMAEMILITFTLRKERNKAFGLKSSLSTEAKLSVRAKVYRSAILRGSFTKD